MTLVVGTVWLAASHRTASQERLAVPPQVAPAEEAPPPVFVAPTPIPAPAAEASTAPVRLSVVNTRGMGVNLRAQAGDRAPRLKTLPEGAVLEAVGPEEHAGGLTWRQVRDAGGTVGWVAADFLAAVTASR